MKNISVDIYGRIAAELCTSSRFGSASYFEGMLAILCKMLPLKAASIYTYVSGNSTLTLRAQVGLSYDAYASYSLPLKSTAGKALRQSRSLVIKDLSVEKGYRDRELISKFGLHSAIMKSLPKFHISNIKSTGESTEALGVICLYPQEDADIEALSDFAESFAQFISEIYANAISHDKLSLREQALIRAVSSSDLNSFLHKVGQILRAEWHYEAISIFVFDERAEVLRLGATTGLKNKIHRKDFFYNVSDNISTTVRCFLTKEIIIHYDEKAYEYNGIIEEDVTHKIKGRIYIPVFAPTSIQGGDARPIGVVRVVNKLISLGGRSEPLGFGDDDIELLIFLTTVIGVISSLFGRAVRAADDLERALHGVQNNLLAVHSRLLQLMERSKVITSIEDQFRHHIPDAIDHLNGLSWQLERFVSGHRTYEYRRTLLLGEVLLLLPNAFRVLLKCFNRSAIGAKLPKFSEVFQEVPPVSADPQALLLVFRNLLENSVKYSHPNKPVEISMSWSTTENQNNLTVYYSDNGIGIDDKDAPYVFNEGYKSESAMRRCTLGAGLGLSQCLEVMKGMRGGIRLKNKSNPTTFEITIPLWEGTS